MKSFFYHNPLHIILLIVLAVFFTFPLTACDPFSSSNTTDGLHTADGQFSPWKPLYRGISLLEIQTAQPRPFRLYALRIDLQDPDVSLFVTPPLNLSATFSPSASAKTPPPTPKPQFLSLYTSSFLEKFSCQAAVNGPAFSPNVTEEGQPQQVIGLVLYEGKIYSPILPHLGALVINQQKQASIITAPLPTNHQYWMGIGGYGPLIQNGQRVPNNEKPNNNLHPRTAMGLSQNNRFLYLLVIDGRQPGFSEGATLDETASWLQQLGAFNALNLDGGGSSTLVVAKPENGARVLNCPIDHHIPGTERPVPVHLGIYAAPLP